MDSTSNLEWQQIDGLDYCQVPVEGPADNPICWVYIRGPKGTVKAYDIGYVPDGFYQTQSWRLWDTYKLILNTLDGHYHCCLSGRVWNF
jgi:hypothetical protein